MTGIKEFTRFWALLMFGSYSVINIIVLLNMLIAMMSNSYQIISERSDTEWKFARSKLWISYFDDGDTLPPPFNLAPTMKNVSRMFGCGKQDKKTGSMMGKDKIIDRYRVSRSKTEKLTELFPKKTRAIAKNRHDTVMRMLVRRYVVAEQRKRDDFGITEDDVMEIRQDISTLRFELIDILRTNGMQTPNVGAADLCGKKGRTMERRLMKDFQIGIVEGIVSDAMKSEKGPKDVFSKIAKAIGKRTSGKGSSKGKDWNAIVQRSKIKRDPIGSTTEAKIKQFNRQSARRHIIEHQSKPLQNMDPQKLVEYNPKLQEVAPATRVAYAKFKIKRIKEEYAQGGSENCSIAPGEDDVFTSQPATVTQTTETSIKGRPRPRSSLTSSGSQSSETRQDQGAIGPQQSFRPKTPIPEDPRENMTTPEPGSLRAKTPTMSTTPTPTPRAKTPTPQPTPTPTQQPLTPTLVPPTPTPPSTSPLPKTSSPTPTSSKEKEDDEKKENEESCAAEKKSDEPKKKPDDDDKDGGNRRPITGVTKAAGKSKITGQVMSGWL